MWFCNKKQKDKPLLTAEQAYQLTKIQKVIQTKTRQLQILDEIASAVKSGCFSRSFYDYYIHSNIILCDEDYSFLEALGYKLTITMYPYNLNAHLMQFGGDAVKPNIVQRKMITVSWDKEKS